MSDKQPQTSSIDRPPEFVARRTFDIGNIIREKNPDLHRRLPRPALAVLNNLTYCNYINREIHAMSALPCRDFPRAALDVLGVTFGAEGHVPDPCVARPVFVANHPLGGLDGLALLAWMLGHYDQVRVPANDILAQFPHLRPVVAPVDKFRPQRDIAKTLHEVFRSRAAVGVFPAGRTSRPVKVGGRLRDYPWQKMVVRMARIHQRPLVPVFIQGRNSWRFHTLYHLRCWLGVQANLEMLLLVDEMMRPTTRRIRLRFGRPFWPMELDGLGEDDQQRIDHLRAACYELESLPVSPPSPCSDATARFPG